MRQLLTFTISFFIASIAYTQTSDRHQNKYKFELGVNVTTILSNVLTNDVNSEITDFPITLKAHSKRRIWRFGFDVDFSKGDNFPLKSHELNVATRIGLEKRVELSDRWRLIYGIDTHYRYLDEKSTSALDFDEIRLHDTSIGLGLSPLFGFQFDLGNRVSLEIETMLLFLAYRETSDLEFANSPTLNTYDEDYTYKITMPDPRFLYLIIKI